ncbi:MAG TPA: hypothetical protein DCR11_01475, partial [Deltaproteobacteria bacterium]|nr:hypothetical protein [Deltaproteobacteria bacterium]
NLRPSASEADALSTELQAQKPNLLKLQKKGMVVKKKWGPAKRSRDIGKSPMPGLLTDCFLVMPAHHGGGADGQERAAPAIVLASYRIKRP